MRKSSVGSAVLGLLAVTVASIGATGVLIGRYLAAPVP